MEPATDGGQGEVCIVQWSGGGGRGARSEMDALVGTRYSDAGYVTEASVEQRCYCRKVPGTGPESGSVSVHVLVVPQASFISREKSRKEIQQRYTPHRLRRRHQFQRDQPHRDLYKDISLLRSTVSATHARGHHAHTPPANRDSLALSHSPPSEPPSGSRRSRCGQTAPAPSNRRATRGGGRA